MTHILEFKYDQIASLKSGDITRYVMLVRASEEIKIDREYHKLTPELASPARTEVYRYGKRELYEGKWLTPCVCGKPHGALLVRRIRQTALQDMNSHDAQQCGFYRVLDFKKDWDKHHARPTQKWDANPQVWVIDFVYHTHLFTTAPLSLDAPLSNQA